MKKSIIIKAEPWLVPESIKFIEGKLTKKSKILETGSGGSTFWFAERAAFVLSFEHSLAWAKRIKVELSKRGISNVRLVYDPSYPKQGLTLGEELFDIVLIDGRGRVASICSSFGNIASGGLVILDNSERRQYKPAIDYLLTVCSFQKTFHEKDWSTTIWQKQ